jgi:hypothetical protein
MKRTCFSSLGIYARILVGPGSGMMGVFDEKKATSFHNIHNILERGRHKSNSRERTYELASLTHVGLSNLTHVRHGSRLLAPSDNPKDKIRLDDASPHS